MFTAKKYITKGIDALVPVGLQSFLWNCIDSMDVESKDYLQVFTLEKVIVCGQTLQKVTHTQEVPPYSKTYVAERWDAITEKIFVIDDEIHCTMLLAKEY